MSTVAEIAALLNVPVRGDATLVLTGVASLEDAGPGDISVLGAESWLKQFAASKAGAVIAHQRIKLPANARPAILEVPDVELAMACVLKHFAPPIPRPAAGVDPSASVHPSAQLADGVAVGPHVVIGERSSIGRNSIIHAGAFVGADVSIGDDCEFFQHVVIRERITIGHRVIIHAGTVVGSDGFGYRWNGKQHVKVPQIGTVTIEDDVELGSCVCVDRAKTGTTRIGRGTKIDNLVQVAHNCQIGPHCMITGQVGLAGSVRLGAGVVLGGQCAVRDHMTLGDGAMVAGCSGVMTDIEAGKVVSGIPAIPHRQQLREQSSLRYLPELRTQVRKLQEEVEKLKQNAKE